MELISGKTERYIKENGFKGKEAVSENGLISTMNSMLGSGKTTKQREKASIPGLMVTVMKETGLNF